MVKVQLKAEPSCPRLEQLSSASWGVQKEGDRRNNKREGKDLLEIHPVKELRLLHTQTKIRRAMGKQCRSQQSLHFAEEEIGRKTDLLGVSGCCGLIITQATLVFGDDRLGGSSCQERLREWASLCWKPRGGVIK